MRRGKVTFTFTSATGEVDVLPSAAQHQVSTALEDDAEVLSNTKLEEQLAGQPADVEAEVIRINTESRPLALQVALLVPILAGLLGFVNGFRMMRRLDPVASASPELAPL